MLTSHFPQRLEQNTVCVDIRDNFPACLNFALIILINLKVTPKGLKPKLLQKKKGKKPLLE